MARDMQPAFTTGEISPGLHSRVDLAKWHSALATCKNCLVHAHGGVSNRAGFKYVGDAPSHSSKCRLIPFEFNTEQTYILAFSDQSMQVIRDGGLVLEPSQNITGITAASPAVITITGHSYSNGETVYITGTGVAALDNKYFTVANATTNTFEVSADGTGWSAGGTASRLFELTTPYLEADLFDLVFTQSADVMTITHPSYQQRDLTRTAHYTWTLTAISFASDLAAPGSMAVAEGGTGSSGTVSNYSYVVTAATNEGDEGPQSSNVVLTTATYSLSATRYAQVTWAAVSGADYYKVYKESPYQSDVFGFIGEASSTEFRDFNYAADTTTTPPIATNPFSGTDDYPAAVTYHQQRKFFGGTNNDPQTLWGTKSSQFSNMDRSRPLQADDRIKLTINSRQVNEIRHLLSLGDLIAFTSGGVWQITSDADGILTPSNAYPVRQGGYGISSLRPLVIGETALYVQKKGQRIRDLAYEFESNAFVGVDLTIMAEHLFKNKSIVDWAYAEDPDGIVWCVRDDGKLLSLTYLREQQVFAWAQHETDGLVESIESISENDVDAVYIAVNRTINGVTKRYIERLDERDYTLIEDAFFVDSGLTFTGATYTISGATQASPVVVTATGHSLNNGDAVWISDVSGMTELNGQHYLVANVTANTFEITDLDGNNIDGTSYTAYTSGGEARYAAKTITGLDHLEAEAVVALSDGNVVQDLTVSSGSITLPDYGSVVHIGLSYSAELETLDLDLRNAMVFSRKKSIARVTLQVRDTRGLKAGSEADRLYELKERDVADGYGSIPETTGNQVFEIDGAWTDGGRVYVRQDYPLPATVLAIIPEVVVSG